MMSQMPKPRAVRSLAMMLGLFIGCLVVGFVGAFFIILSVNLGHLDCGNACVSSVAPYHSQDILAQVVYWLFVGLGAAPLVLTAKTARAENKTKTRLILAVALILGLATTILIYLIMFPLGGIGGASSSDPILPNLQ